MSCAPRNGIDPRATPEAAVWTRSESVAIKLPAHSSPAPISGSRSNNFQHAPVRHWEFRVRFGCLAACVPQTHSGILAAVTLIQQKMTLFDMS